MQMISIISLFLPLMVGVVPVELNVGDEVASVQILLDDKQVAELRGEPWEATCDLGQQLLPHRIDAVAFDASGKEVGRVSRWVNLAQNDARVDLVVEEVENVGKAIRVLTEHAKDLLPILTRVNLNGLPLKMTAGVWPLPGENVQGPLLVHAEVHFPAGLVVTKDVVLGEQKIDVDSHLTAVLVESSGDGELTLESLAGKLSSGGKTLEVVAVEKADARVLVVFDDSAKKDWTSMRFESGRRSNTGSSYVSGGTSSFTQLRMHKNMAVTGFTDDVALQVVSAVPDKPTPSTQSYKTSPPIKPPDGNAVVGLTGFRPQFDREAKHTLADSVAVAGWMAATNNLRRAVVLITGSKAEDSSIFSPETIRRYLTAMGVPLEVWTPQKRKIKKSPWGEITRTSNLRQLDVAVNDLATRLEQQRIVWVKGSYLPNQIHLRGGAGITLVTSN